MVTFKWLTAASMDIPKSAKKRSKALTKADQVDRDRVPVLHAQVRDVFHERQALLGRDVRHEAEVQDADLAVGRADEVARVRVRVQVPRLQQLDEVRVQQRGAQLPYVGGVALAQLLACYTPATDVMTAASTGAVTTDSRTREGFSDGEPQMYAAADEADMHQTCAGPSAVHRQRGGAPSIHAVVSTKGVVRSV